MPWEEDLQGRHIEPGMRMLSPPAWRRNEDDPEPTFGSFCQRAENVALVRRALRRVVDVLELGEDRLLDINAAVSGPATTLWSCL